MKRRTLARPEDKEDLLRRLAALRPESARRWGRMSAHQMVCHAYDALQMSLGEQPVTSRGRLWERTAVKWIALYAPLRWPPGILTSPELDQVQGAGTGPVEFSADVARLQALVERAAALPVRTRCPAHPVFGAMSDAAWRRWAWLHTDHHLRQFGV
jgi:hypothetical protein